MNTSPLHVTRRNSGGQTDRCAHCQFGTLYLCLRLSPLLRSSTSGPVFPMHHCSHMTDGANCFRVSYARRSSATVCMGIRQAIAVCVRPSPVTSESLVVWRLQQTM